MNLRKFIFHLLMIMTFAVRGQEYPTESIPNGLKSRATAILRDEHINIDMKAEDNIIETVTRAITILNKSGEDYADLTVYYDKSKSIKDIKGVIYDEFGKQIRKFGQKDFKDFSATDGISMYADLRVKHYAPSMTTFPYTIVYTYEIKHGQNLFIPYWYPNRISDIAVEKSTYQFSCKPNLNLRIKSENIQAEATITSNDKGKTYTWTASNINARKTEPLSPIDHPKKMIVKIVPETFQYFKRNGMVNDWKDFGKWVHDELLLGKQDLPAATIQKAKDIASKFDNPKDKARALYEFMQNKTRYVSIQVGIGGLEPFPASYVDRLGYGDCKALVNYMQALLSAVDIPSLYCIVEAGSTKVDLDQSFANAVDGNHIILCIPFENDTTWLECTSNKSPFGYLGDFTDDRLVLACTPNGGKVLRTTVYPSSKSLQIRKNLFKVSKEGNIQGTVHTNFSGSQFENQFANIFNSLPDQNKQLKIYYDVNNIVFDKIDYKVENNTEPILHENITINIRNYVVKNGKNYILSPNVFNIQRNIPESKNRITPLYINRGYTDIDEGEFVFEEKLKGFLVPVNEVFESPMGKYELKISSEGQKVKYYRKLEIKDGTYPAEAYETYFDFISKVASHDHIRYTITIADE
ncbi:DUF3857 domain-containing protein [Sphingobacterium bovistauri]|uniref:DUF3857 domain-containing transglutaminase family protein n=1 Tax=Sphingobacterium bovistauri TaxID=2781959 RepID=A0ABS7Z6N4_9SPHI|nr:DUF3857 domain-containing transglutaminase family protein [Sphingobacterium bovistauri]MCA5005841.1 DUF3857 domain-containing transglutaminase family protein [Sphingobacterium bovistauri]